MGDAYKIKAFHEAMLSLYWQTLDNRLLGYTAGAFGMEVREFGGLERQKDASTAKSLVRAFGRCV